jgi:poly(3-hydroxybutyrate) depolymerase
MTEFADWGKRNGCTGAPVTRADKQIDLVTYPKCDQKVELLRINGGRHSWPVGAAKKITEFFQL